VFFLIIAMSFFSLPKNLYFSSTSLGGESLIISATLSLDLLELDDTLVFGTLDKNLLEILFLNEMFSLLV